METLSLWSEPTAVPSGTLSRGAGDFFRAYLDLRPESSRPPFACEWAEGAEVNSFVCFVFGRCASETYPPSAQEVYPPKTSVPTIGLGSVPP